MRILPIIGQQKQQQSVASFGSIVAGEKRLLSNMKPYLSADVFEKLEKGVDGLCTELRNDGKSYLVGLSYSRLNNENFDKPVTKLSNEPTMRMGLESFKHQNYFDNGGLTFTTIGTLDNPQEAAKIIREILSAKALPLDPKIAEKLAAEKKQLLAGSKHLLAQYVNQLQNIKMDEVSIRNKNHLKPDFNPAKLLEILESSNDPDIVAGLKEIPAKPAKDFNKLKFFISQYAQIIRSLGSDESNPGALILKEFEIIIPPKTSWGESKEGIVDIHVSDGVDRARDTIVKILEKHLDPNIAKNSSLADIQKATAESIAQIKDPKLREGLLTEFKNNPNSSISEGVKKAEQVITYNAGHPSAETINIVVYDGNALGYSSLKSLGESHYEDQKSIKMSSKPYYSMSMSAEDLISGIRTFCQERFKVFEGQ